MHLGKGKGNKTWCWTSNLAIEHIVEHNQYLLPDYDHLELTKGSTLVQPFFVVVPSLVLRPVDNILLYMRSNGNLSEENHQQCTSTMDYTYKTNTFLPPLRQAFSQNTTRSKHNKAPLWPHVLIEVYQDMGCDGHLAEWKKTLKAKDQSK